MFDQVDFSALELPPSARALQREVREFLRTELAALGFTPHLGHAEFHAELHAPGRRTRLDRHDLAQALRRTGALVSRPLRRDRGNARGRRAVRGALVRRSPDRAEPAALWHRSTAPAFPAGDRARRILFRARHERAEFGFRSCVGQDARGARAERLARHRPESVDELGAQGACVLRAVPHVARHRQPPRRIVAARSSSSMRPASQCGRSVS